jgi:hypothetical protein
MDYTETNRDRNMRAERSRMPMTGRGLLTLNVANRPTKLSREASRLVAKSRRKAR